MTEIVTAINTQVHLFYNALSQLDMSIVELTEVGGKLNSSGSEAPIQELAVGT